MPKSVTTTSSALAGQFSTLEMQAIAAVNTGKTVTGETVVDLTIEGLYDHARLLRRRKMLGRRLEIDRLIGKLRALDPGQRVELGEKLGALVRRDAADFFSARLPSVNVLAAYGLVARTGVPAWGYAAVVNPHRSHVLIMCSQPTGSQLASKDLQELAEWADRLLTHDPFGESDQDMLIAVLHAIAQQTGWRHFLVKRWTDGPAELVRMRARDLISDLDSRSIAPLVLEGVNAPLPDGGVLI